MKTASSIRIIRSTGVALAGIVLALGTGNVAAKMFDTDPVGPTAAGAVQAGTTDALYDGHQQARNWPHDRTAAATGDTVAERAGD